MEFMGITGVAGIVVICYLVGLVGQATPWNNNKIRPHRVRHGRCGAGRGGHVCMPEFPAADPITAVAVGIVSGLAATGADQIAKQLKQ